MARYRSPFYMDPQFAAIGSNLAKAFMPGDASEIARGRYYRIKADSAQREFDARRSIADRFRQAQGGPMEPNAVAGTTGDAIEAGNIGDVAKAQLYYTSNTGQAAPSVARAFVGAGHAIGENQGVTLEDREAVAARADKARMARTATSASIGAGPGYARVAEDRRQFGERQKFDREKWESERDFKERTRFDKPETVPEGHAVFPNATDPRFTGVEQGSIPAPRANAERGFTLSPGQTRFGPDGKPLATNEKPDPDKRYTLSPGTRMVDAQGNVVAEGPPPAERAPMDVSADDLANIEWSALRDIPGALKSDGGTDEAFVEMHKEKIQRARAAMAAVYQRTRNANEGRLAYMRELALEPGDRFEQPGMVGRMFGEQPAMTRGGAPLPAPPAVGGGQTAAPQGGGPPPAPPAPAQRQPGQVYNTPRGPMRWTGTGWVPAQ